MKTTTILIYLASAMAAAAHPGHDTAFATDSAAHWLLSPLHGLGVIALAMVFALARHLLHRGNGHE